MTAMPGIVPLNPAFSVGKGDHAAARRAAEDFESVFVNQLLESMSEGLKSEGPFTGGEGEKTYRSLLNDSIAKEIARHGGIGIADQVYREILKMQEAAAPPAAQQATAGEPAP